MRYRDTIRVRIAGHRAWIDPAALTRLLSDDAKALPRVTAWSEQSGLLICRDCADDAKRGGARLTQTTVVKGRLCEYCGQEIGSND